MRDLEKSFADAKDTARLLGLFESLALESRVNFAAVEEVSEAVDHEANLKWEVEEEGFLPLGDDGWSWV